MINKRRAHPKIAELPEELRKAVHQKITEGFTYQEISNWITSAGHPVSRSAVGSYGKKYLTKLEGIRLARDQAKTIVEEGSDKPATELIEATSSLAQQLIFEHLVKNEIDFNKVKADRLIQALSMLERSTVAREKLKLDSKHRADEAVKNIEKVAVNKGIDE
ncbi:MAG: phage protein Gp27 family protein, partial [Acidaminococcaceae bacterium]